MTTPFEATTIGGIEVKNRIFRSATFESYATDNKPNEQFYNMYKNLAQGEVGLIITGYMLFAKTDQYSPNIAAVNNETLPSLKKVTDVVHKYGSKIVVQLNHATSQFFGAPEGHVYGPSAYTDPVTGISVTAFSTEQIQDLIKEFTTAASIAQSAGFDGVQIHGAHGYLLNKFLSPAFNKRDDEYGGSAENRMRIMVEILAEIKKTCGDDFPVWTKLNCSDFQLEDEGVTESAFLHTSKVLAEKGIDAIEVSGGNMFGKHSFSRSKKHVFYHLEQAKKAAQSVDTDIILVGGIKEIDTIETVLNDTAIKAISLSRPLVREPNLVNRWANGNRTKATCVSCNGCFNPTGLRCFFELTAEEKEAVKPIMQMVNSNS